MSVRDYPSAMFLACSIGLSVVATIGFGAFANVAVNRVSLASALSMQFDEAVSHPFVACYVCLPFLALGGISAGVARWRDFNRGLTVLLPGLLLLSFLYFNGYQDAQVALQNRHWTAAALSVGLLPLMSIPVLLICALLGIFSRMRKE